jgi:cytochrome c oxidase subunit 3
MAFMATQVFAWMELWTGGIEVNSTPAGSFLYVISGAHLVHALGGVITLIVFTILAFRKYKTPDDTLAENVNTTKQVGVELVATYWHFVDILWVYLFLFFLINQ